MGFSIKMETIYKYKIPKNFSFELELPIFAKILSVQMQGQDAFIWAMINTNNITEKRLFTIITTGCEIDERYKLNYISTFQVVEFHKTFVFHLFEIMGKND